ncbi:uncharacterized protein [Typha angustifolia]|uniref:uncharacterized protein n=1 Tax=Typha angustifolia TaxID=59011 RepID=UPI003C2B4E7A
MKTRRRQFVERLTSEISYLEFNLNPTKKSEEEERDWSGLIDSMLFSILGRLETLEDFFSFRGVCRNWRSISSPCPETLASQSPLILLTRFPSYTEAFFDISRRRLYNFQLPWRLYSRFSLAFSHGFLVTSTEPPRSRILLWNLFSGDHIRLPRSPEPFRRVILSSPPSSPQCLMVLFHPGNSTIQFSWLGDSLWKVHSWGPAHLIHDMIFFQGRLFALINGRLALVDLAPCPQFTLLEDSLDVEWKRNSQRFLAKSGEELLLVCCFEFSIFRWAFGGGGWVELKSLDGRALFIGLGGFAASVVPPCLGVRENCVYFAGRNADGWCEFSLKDRCLETVSVASPGLLRSQTSLPPIWVLPSLS